MDHENFKAFAVGVHVSEVESIAVACTCAQYFYAVMVKDGRSVDNFVKAVAVTVADCQRVGAFAIEALA